MQYELEKKLAAAWPPERWQDVGVVVGVSGGCDSVALLRALAAIKSGGKGRLIAAHLNHQLRSQAEDDERFVAELCRRLDVGCEIGRADIFALARQRGEGLEDAARHARYRFLTAVAERCGARFVAVAHTADDQAETVLHRIVRGTGLRGLSGMARARPLAHATLVRPLLEVRRAEVQAYLAALGQTYQFDCSNSDPRFTRNRLRLEVLPLLEKINPDVVEALLRLARLARESQTLIDRLVEECRRRRVAGEKPGLVQIDLAPPAQEPRHLVRELLMTLWREQGWPMRAMGWKQWEELAAMASLPEAPQRRTFPGAVLAEVREGRLQLSREADKKEN